jgi:hypothetical protein
LFSTSTRSFTSRLARISSTTPERWRNGRGQLRGPLPARWRHRRKWARAGDGLRGAASSEARWRMAPPEGWPFGATLPPFGAGVDGPGPSESRRSRASGSGRSATWVRRMTAISAAIIAFGACETSSIDFSSICHMRVSARIGRLCAMLSAARLFVRGHGRVVCRFGRDLDDGNPVRDLGQIAQDGHRVGAVGILGLDSSAKAAAASPFRIMSKRSRTRPRSARPSMART